MTRESEPEALDTLERHHRQLQIEIHALEREKDDASKTRLEAARQEAANVSEELRPMREKYESEKQHSRQVQDAKIKLESLWVKRDEAERSGDTQTAADLEYYAIPDTKALIERFEAEHAKADAERRAMAGETGETLLADVVGPDQINEIVARWTGIPVTRLKTTEKDKLLNMERWLGRIVVGQKEAVTSVSNAIRLQRSGLGNPNSPPSFLFCGPSGTGKTLLTKARCLLDTYRYITFCLQRWKSQFVVAAMGTVVQAHMNIVVATRAMQPIAWIYTQFYMKVIQFVANIQAVHQFFCQCHGDHIVSS